MSRRDTISFPAWRVQVFRANGAIAAEATFQARSESELPECRTMANGYFAEAHLADGERAEYQSRQAGRARYVTHATREAEGVSPHSPIACTSCKGTGKQPLHSEQRMTRCLPCRGTGLVAP